MQKNIILILLLARIKSKAIGRPFCRGYHRVTDLDTFPVRISKDKTPKPLPVAGPLFISPLLFRLSRALLGAWRFGLFRGVYSSFHKGPDLTREPAFNGCFIPFSQFIFVGFI